MQSRGISRRELLKGAAGGTILAVAGATGLFRPGLPPSVLKRALAAQGTPLAGSGIPQFVDPLPLLSVACRRRTSSSRPSARRLFNAACPA